MARAGVAAVVFATGRYVLLKPFRAARADIVQLLLAFADDANRPVSGSAAASVRAARR